MTDGFEFDEQLFPNPYYQEELLLQMGIEQLMLQNDSESSDDEDGESDVQLVESEPELKQPKSRKQSQITDFFHN